MNAVAYNLINNDIHFNQIFCYNFVEEHIGANQLFLNIKRFQILKAKSVSKPLTVANIELKLSY